MEATMEDGTPVVWPTSPEDSMDAVNVKQEMIDDNESEEEDQPRYFSHWFGSDLATDQDAGNMSTERESEGDQSNSNSMETSDKKRRLRTESDSDPDWTEENDGVVTPARKRAARGQRKLDQSRYQPVVGTPQHVTLSDGGKVFSPRFRFSWTEEFHWLHYDAKIRLMFCRVCQGAGRVGEFSTQGCGNFTKLALRVHDVSQEHVESGYLVKSITDEGASLVETGPMAKVSANEEEDTDEDTDSQNTLYSEGALIVALRTAYYAAHQPDGERQPTQVYRSMMALQDSCNVQGAKELRLGRQPRQKCTLDNVPLGEEQQQPEYAFGDEESLAEMHDVLARIVQEDLYSKVSQSEFLTIVIQEHPDADLQPGKTQLVIHARYTYRGKVCVGFLATIMVTEDSPQETVDAVMRVLQECELPSEKVVAVQIQCPKKNGKAVTTSDMHHWAIAKGFVDLGKKIVLVSAQKHPPWNMCLSLAMQKLDEGTKYQHLLGRLVTFLQSIANKLEAIEPLKDLVNDPLCQWDALQMPPWMMVQKTIKAVCSTWSTLIEVLQTEADIEQEDNQGKQLLEDLHKYQFLAFIHFLLDVIAVARDLEVQLNYKTPNEACKHITDALTDLQENPGDNEHRFVDGCDSENKTFHNHRMYFTEQQRVRVDQMRSDYIQEVSKLIEARCAVIDKAGVRRAFRILNPKLLASLKDYELGEFGRDDLRTLMGTFFANLAPDKDLFPEYQEMKMILFKHHKDDSFKTTSEKLGMCKNQSLMLMSLPRIAYITKLLHCAITIPGVCVKADQHVGKLLRQSHDFMEKYGTDATTLSRMMIATHGQKINTFDFIAALQEWNSL